MSTLYNLLYTSKRNENCSGLDVLDIVEKSSIKNHQKNITGILVQSEDYFIQYLEGDDSILDLFKVIKSDPRHSDVVLVNFSKLKTERLFSKWNMAYRDINSGKNEFVTKVTNSEMLVFESILNGTFEGISNDKIIKLMNFISSIK